MSKLLGLRVVAKAEVGEDWGVARVRYSIPHQHGMKYEIERSDGSAFLADYADCRPAPNWNETPEEHQFIGSEWYKPKFLAGATRQHRIFGTDHGVVVPSDMDALRALVARIEPGFRVQWYSHGCNEFRGGVTVESVDSKGLRVKSPTGAPTSCVWPTAPIEFGPQYAYEFQVEGDAFHSVRVPPRRTGKGPSRALSLTFSPPRVTNRPRTTDTLA